ncbi:MAG TPA: PIN domain-containing protein [Jatrophihabitans sp.]|nr:PIN domain-containing protein [Jatrophihabitans sp.]
MRVVLDTSVLLGPAPELGDAEVAISAMSLAELHYGVLIASTGATRSERLRRLGIIEKTFDALPVDDAVAREYGRLAAAVAEVGRQPRDRVADLLIAATAAAHNAELWTRNAADFAGVEALVAIRAVAS